MGSHCCRCCHTIDFYRDVTLEDFSVNLNPNLKPIETPSLLSFEDESDEMVKNVFIGDETRCFVCLENYNEQRNQPMIMPCGHIVCNICLIQLAKTFQYKEIKCPLDNHMHKVNRSKRRRNQSQATVPSTRNPAIGRSNQAVQDGNFLPQDSPSGSRSNADNVSPIQLHVLADVHDQRGFHVIPDPRFIPPRSFPFISSSSANAKNQNSRDSFPMFSLSKHSPSENIPVVTTSCKLSRNTINSSECYYDKRLPEPVPDYSTDSSEDEDIYP